MKEAFKILFLFKKPSWDYFRPPYIFFSTFIWAEIIAVLLIILTKFK